MDTVLFNGGLLDKNRVNFTAHNRAFKYGDGVFETIKYANGKILFWEDHYFRLMSSMRILRMEIPMDFSPETLEERILETISANHAEQDANRIRLTVYRAGAGRYTPETNEIEYLVESEKWPQASYELNESGLSIDLFKDYYKQKGLLSNLKTANSLLYVLAGIFKNENRLDECVLLNDDKHVVEAISSNLFMVKDGVLHTPATDTGCLKGVMRKNIIALARKMKLQVIEDRFSPFELQKADEVWLTNAMTGVQWVGNYRKKIYGNELAVKMIEALNQSV